MKKNKFDLSHEKKLSFNAGILYPMLVQDVLPGDSFKIDTEVFTRMSPLIAPVLHRLDLKTEFYFVPTRLIWDDSEEFFTRGRNNDSNVTVPRIIVTESTKSIFQKGSLGDYMGVSPTTGKTLTSSHMVSALPFRAYQQIYNDHYRNQEVRNEFTFTKGSADIAGAEIYDITQLRWRNWAKDYFTSAKSQATLNPEINSIIPLAAGDGGDLYKLESKIIVGATGALPASLNTLQGTTTGEIFQNGSGSMRIENLNENGGLGIAVEEIRRMSAMQKWIELMINTGYRYVDYLRGFWGVRSKDGRMQISEFLGGSSQPIRISEVLNTSDTANAPQGNASGHGISSGDVRTINRTFDEHGYIIGIVSVVPKATYFQGIPAHFFKFDHLDYANPLLANLGAQELPVRELYYDWTKTAVQNAANFAYKPRYSEYKYGMDSMHGDFRDNLAFWTFARNFTSQPGFDSTFCECRPVSSPFAVLTGDHYYAQIYHKISALRKLPYYAVPQIQ